MNFFEQQDRARRKTRWIIFFFCLAILATALSVSLSVGFFIRLQDPSFEFSWTRMELWLVGLGVLTTIVIGSLWRLWSLSDGGVSIALMLGGRLVDRETTKSEQEKILLNVVEEMAIASGTPVPTVFIMDQESSINAFAAGFTMQDAVIAVTKGCLQSLSRDELQAVIGHEFSHISNGDMRLNMRLLGMLHGLVLLTIVGRTLLRGGRGGRRKGGGQVALFGLGLFILGWFGYFFGRLLQASASRQREFLADASSVQFTRNAPALVGALTKIGRTASGSLIANERSDEARHFFFSNAFPTSWNSFFSTHPPLEERIHALDPRLKIKFENFEEPPTDPTPSNIVQRFAPPRQSAGQISEASLEWSKNFLSDIPPALNSAIQDPLKVRALISAMFVVSADSPHEFMASLTPKLPAPLMLDIQQLVPQLIPLRSQRLSLFLLCLGSLGTYSIAQIKELEGSLAMILKSGLKFQLFEFSLLKMIEWKRRRLSGQRPVVKYHALKPLSDDMLLLLSAAAQLSSQATELAFSKGLQRLGLPRDQRFDIRRPDLKSVNLSLDRMQYASPALKERFLEACRESILADRTVNPEEWDYLRSIAIVLECPIPPL